MTRLKDRRFLTDLGFAILAAALVLAFGRVYSGFVQDDAYITYRYARNLATGIGFVYNVGEHVLGTSTPLYTVGLAVLARITGLAVPAVGGAIWLGGLWLATVGLYALGQPASRVLGAVTALIFTTNPFLRHMVGTEATLLLALIVWTTWAIIRGRLLVASVLVGVLILTRYELGLYALILAGYAWFRLRQRPLWLLPAAVIVAAWVLYASVRFGSPIPTSYYAKLAASRIPFLGGLVFYWYRFTVENWFFGVEAFLLLVGAAAVALHRRVQPAYALLLIFAAAYAAIAAPVAGSFPWYYAPLIPAIAIAIVEGARYLAVGPESHPGDPGKVRDRTLLRHVLMVLLLGSAIVSNLSYWVRDWKLYRGGPWDYRFNAYSEASAWLRDHMEPDQTLASSEIGYIGYFTDARIIDLYGLVTPEVLPWLSSGLEFTTARVVEAYRPDYVLIDIGPRRPESFGLPSTYLPAAIFGGRYQVYSRSLRSE